VPSRRFLVTGRVQGVGFRAFVEGRAVTLGLSGWVRNRVNGDVEIEAFGDETALAELHHACATGPRFAGVAAVYDLPPSGEPAPAGFERRASH
jgi:acylphosphatase